MGFDELACGTRPAERLMQATPVDAPGKNRLTRVRFPPSPRWGSYVASRGASPHHYLPERQLAFENGFRGITEGPRNILNP